MRNSRVIGMFAAWLLSGLALAADKSTTLDTGDVLTIDWGTDWVVGTNPPESLPGTLTITGPDATSWRIVVGPLPPHPTLTADAGNLRMYVRWMQRGLEEHGAEVNQEQKTIDGRHARGLYFQVRDARKKTKAQIRKDGGDWTDAYVGALNIGSRAWLFEVAWIKGGEAGAKQALAAIRTLRVRSAP